jgi:hypothetical protein
MSEFVNLAKTLESSLTAAVRSEEGLATISDMPGLSQFDTYSLLNVSLNSELLENTAEDIIYETSDTGEIAVVEEVVTEESTPALEETVEIIIKRPVPVKTEEELWLESNEFGFNDIEVVDGDEDYFELLEEPDMEPVATLAPEERPKQERRISEDQVVLVVEQLVVNPNQATTVVSQGGNTVMQPGVAMPQEGAAGIPQNIVYQTPPQPQQIIYSPAPVQAQPQIIVQPQAQGNAPVVDGQAPVTPVAAPQQMPQFYQPPAPAPIIYQQAPAPAQEISVNIINDNANQPAPIVYQTVNQAAPTLPTEEQTKRHFDHKDSDQVIEIRSDATSVSANTVSVSSTAPMFPNLTNFDPRKYFSPNEIAAPRMEEAEFQKTVEEAKEQGSSAMTYTESPAVAQIQDYSSPSLGYNALALEGEMGEPEDMQKVTQMFQELRRMREK